MYIDNNHPQSEVDKLALSIYADSGHISLEKAYIMARLRLKVPKIRKYESKDNKSKGRSFVNPF